METLVLAVETASAAEVAPAVEMRGSQRGARRTSLPPQPHYTENTSTPVLPVIVPASSEVPPASYLTALPTIKALSDD
ncbi:hypothetical protein ROHU_000312 [Labeo rohita]|uniref:Uncharacterized protein n=1 Tax=Labeo rohita TaxID=84645 RepID=A0A498P4Y9_LABRO|nr:hypothetical protein ROHU_000312 [Labeo rohita]